MAKREELRDELRALLGSTNTYFQPPASVRMKYPCFIYSFDGVDKVNADNRPYRMTNRYQVTYVSKELDMDFIKRILEHFPMCSLNRAPYVVDNLYHTVFSLFY